MGDYSVLQEEILNASPEARELLKKTASKRRIALMLVRMRAKKDLTQKDIVDRSGLDKSTVSRLEGAQGGVPDLHTLARFAEACGMALGLVAIDKDDIVDEKYYHIVDSVTVAASDGPTGNVFHRFRDGRLPYVPNDEASEDE